MMTYARIHSELKKLIKKNYGPNCTLYDLSCVVCRMYIALDIIKDAVDMDKGAKKFEAKAKKKV